MMCILEIVCPLGFVPKFENGQVSEIGEGIERSRVEIEVNERELILYLASALKQKENEEDGWGDFVHKRKTNRGGDRRKRKW